jgi:FAD/FMN-containing dehydrogenase
MFALSWMGRHSIGLMSVNIDNQLQQLIGAGLATVDVRDVRGWSPWHQHEMRTERATFIAPSDRSAFVKTVEFLSGSGIAYELVGGGTSTSRPSGAKVFIDTKCLDQLTIDPETQELVVGAGVAIDTAEAFVAPHGWTLGQWLGSGSTATIGGAVATNASGVLAGRYGSFRDAISFVETIDRTGNISWVDANTFRSSGDIHILGARVPLWLSPDGRAVARFTGVNDSFAALRQIATARLAPAHISVDHLGDITVIVEGEPHLETARYQLIAAILQKHGAVQDITLDQTQHWDSLLMANPWSANAARGIWADRIVQNTRWSEVAVQVEKWSKRAKSAGAELKWRADNPTSSGVQLIIDISVSGTESEPHWLYETL